MVCCNKNCDNSNVQVNMQHFESNGRNGFLKKKKKKNNNKKTSCCMWFTWHGISLAVRINSHFQFWKGSTCFPKIHWIECFWKSAVCHCAGLIVGRGERSNNTQEYGHDRVTTERHKVEAGSHNCSHVSISKPEKSGTRLSCLGQCWRTTST